MIDSAQAATGKLTLCGCVTEKQSWRKAFENEVPNSSVCNYSTSVYDWGGGWGAFIRYMQKHQGVLSKISWINPELEINQAQEFRIHGDQRVVKSAQNISRETSVEQIGPRRRTRIQRTRLISTHAIRVAALLPVLSNLKGDASTFCWSNNPSLSFTAALLSLVRRPRVSTTEKQTSKFSTRGLITCSGFSGVFQSPGGGTFRHSNSLVRISHAGTLGWGGVRPTSSCSFCQRREHYKCVAVILAQDPAVNHDAQKHTRSSWKVFSSAFCQIQIQGRPNLIGEYVT